MDADDFGLLRNLQRDEVLNVPRMDGSVEDATRLCPMLAVAITESGSAEPVESGPIRFVMRNGTVANGVAPPMWLTPSANEDAAGTPKGDMQKMLGNHPLIRGTTPEEWRSGTLNPRWVEWLMGWPIGQSSLLPLETDRFLQWLQKHGEFSKKGVDSRTSAE